MTLHALKSWPGFFNAVMAGDKLHDLRRMDRKFNVGDRLLLREFDPDVDQYTGRTLKVEVTYMTATQLPCALSRDALHPDFCILSIKKVEAT